MNLYERQRRRSVSIASLAFASKLFHGQVTRYVATFLGILVGFFAVNVSSAAAADCANLTSFTAESTTITSAAVVPASGIIPEYCKIEGNIHNFSRSPILFEVALPTTKWNGKYFVAGGGGFNGTIPKLDQALAEGYAAAGSDTGHHGESLDGSWALNNLEAQVNYAYLATHLLTQVGKEILRAYYGQHEKRSYFVGCSNGGKMALAEVQRYPDDFDAAIAGDPVIDRTKLMMSYTWNAQALAKAPIPATNIPVLERGTMVACRETAGVADGVMVTPGRCNFDPQTIVCASGNGANCLTPGQAQAWQKVLQGPVNSAGQELYPGFPPGHEDDYSSFITGSGETSSYPSSQWKFQDQFMRNIIFGLNFDPVKQFNFDTSLAALVPFAGDQDSANPDLTAFKAHGGRLIMYHGWADHSITPVRSIEYYASVIDMMRTDAGQFSGEENSDQVSDFFRLFMVPGMHHCGGGPGPNTFGGANQGTPQPLDAQHDIVMALDQWVENGIAPEKIIAAHHTNGAVDRTMPLCPYPQTAVYNGSGDMKVAESYHCEQHSFWWPVEAVANAKMNPSTVEASATAR
jgi:feruloyl esterase